MEIRINKQEKKRESVEKPITSKMGDFRGFCSVGHGKKYGRKEYFCAMTFVALGRRLYGAQDVKKTAGKRL